MEYFNNVNNVSLFRIKFSRPEPRYVNNRRACRSGCDVQDDTTANGVSPSKSEGIPAECLVLIRAQKPSLFDMRLVTQVETWASRHCRAVDNVRRIYTYNVEPLLPG